MPNVKQSSSVGQPRQPHTPFRYIGISFKAMFDGEPLRPGDVVHLNEDQALAFAERFEAVSDEPAAAASYGREGSDTERCLAPLRAHSARVSYWPLRLPTRCSLRGTAEACSVRPDLTHGCPF